MKKKSEDSIIPGKMKQSCWIPVTKIGQWVYKVSQSVVVPLIVLHSILMIAHCFSVTDDDNIDLMSIFYSLFTKDSFFNDADGIMQYTNKRYKDNIGIFFIQTIFGALWIMFGLCQVVQPIHDRLKDKITEKWFKLIPWAYKISCLLSTVCKDSNYLFNCDALC